MSAWTHLFEAGPALILLIALLVPQTAVAAPYEHDTTDIEYYPVADSTGCYYNFQHYDEGDRIITNEPCLNCTCHNRMLMCYLRVCPFTKAIGQDCKVEKRADQCCPVITCPEVPVQLLPSTTQSSTAVGHLDAYGCSIDGLFYTDGARVPSDPNKPCELCYCIRNKTACVMQQCTLEVDGCKPVYQEGVCCPVRYNCEHPDYLLETTTRRLITTTTSAPTTTLAGPVDCIYDNEVYADGALIIKDKPCERCYCMKGDIICAVQKCNPTPLDKVNCTALPPKEGQCCPDNYECDNINEEEFTTEFTTLSPVSYDESATSHPELASKPDEEVSATPSPSDEENEIPQAGEETTVTSAGKEGEQEPVTVLPSKDEKESPKLPKHEHPEEGVTTPQTDSTGSATQRTEKPTQQDQITEQPDIYQTTSGTGETELPGQEVNEIPQEHEIVTAGPDIPVQDEIVHTDEAEYPTHLPEELGSGEGIQVTEPSRSGITETPKQHETEGPVTEPQQVEQVEVTEQQQIEPQQTEVPQKHEPEQPLEPETTQQPEEYVTKLETEEGTAAEATGTELPQQSHTDKPEYISSEEPTELPEKHVTSTEIGEGIEPELSQKPIYATDEQPPSEEPQHVPLPEDEEEETPQQHEVEPEEPETGKGKATESPPEQVTLRKEPDTTEHPHIIQHVTEVAPAIGTGLPQEMEAEGQATELPESEKTQENATEELQTEKPQVEITQSPLEHEPIEGEGTESVQKPFTTQPSDKGQDTEIPEQGVTEMVPVQGTTLPQAAVSESEMTESPKAHVTEETIPTTKLPQELPKESPAEESESTESFKEHVTPLSEEQDETTNVPKDHLEGEKGTESPKELVTETDHTELPKEEKDTESPKEYVTQVPIAESESTELPKEEELPQEYFTQAPGEKAETPKSEDERESTRLPEEHVTPSGEEEATELATTQKSIEKVTDLPQEQTTESQATGTELPKGTISKEHPEILPEHVTETRSEMPESEKSTEVPHEVLTTEPSFAEKTEEPTEYVTKESPVEQLTEKETPEVQGTELPKGAAASESTEVPSQEVTRENELPEGQITEGSSEEGEATEASQTQVPLTGTKEGEVTESPSEEGEVPETSQAQVPITGTKEGEVTGEPQESATIPETSQTQVPITGMKEGEVTGEPQESATTELPKDHIPKEVSQDESERPETPEHTTEVKLEQTTKYVKEPSVIEGEIEHDHLPEVPEEQTEKTIKEQESESAEEKITTMEPSADDKSKATLPTAEEHSEGKDTELETYTSEPSFAEVPTEGDTTKYQSEIITTESTKLEPETLGEKSTEKPQDITGVSAEGKGTTLPEYITEPQIISSTELPEKDLEEKSTQKQPEKEAEEETTKLPEQTTQHVEEPSKAHSEEPSETESVLGESTTVADSEKGISSEATEGPVHDDLEHPSESEHVIPGEGNCLVDGQTYKNNSDVPPINHCQVSCRCVSSILQCESVTCTPPPANLQHCMPVYQGPDSCCPTYSCTVPGVTSMESDSHKMETTTKETIPGSIDVNLIIPSEEGTVKPEGTTASGREGTELPEFTLPEEYPSQTHLPVTEVPRETELAESPQITTLKADHTEGPVESVTSNKEVSEKETEPKQVTEKTEEEETTKAPQEAEPESEPEKEPEVQAATAYPSFISHDELPDEEDNIIDDHFTPEIAPKLPEIETATTELSEKEQPGTIPSESQPTVTEYAPESAKDEGVTEVPAVSVTEESLQYTTKKQEEEPETIPEYVTKEFSEVPKSITMAPEEVIKTMEGEKKGEEPGAPGESATEGLPHEGTTMAEGGKESPVQFPTSEKSVPEGEQETVEGGEEGLATTSSPEKSITEGERDDTVHVTAGAPTEYVTESVQEEATKSVEEEKEGSVAVTMSTPEESVTETVPQIGGETEGVGHVTMSTPKESPTTEVSPEPVTEKVEKSPEEQTTIESVTDGVKTGITESAETAGVPEISVTEGEVEHKASTPEKISDVTTASSEEHVPEQEETTEAMKQETQATPTESSKTTTKIETETQRADSEAGIQATVTESQEFVTEKHIPHFDGVYPHEEEAHTEQKPEEHVTVTESPVQVTEKLAEPEQPAVTETIPDQRPEHETVQAVTDSSATEKMPEIVSHVTEKIDEKQPPLQEEGTTTEGIEEIQEPTESIPSEEEKSEHIPPGGKVEITTVQDEYVTSVGEETSTSEPAEPEATESGIPKPAKPEATKPGEVPEVTTAQAEHVPTTGEMAVPEVTAAETFTAEEATEKLHAPTIPSESHVTEKGEPIIPEVSSSPSEKPEPGTTLPPKYIPEVITSGEGLPGSVDVTEKEGERTTHRYISESSTLSPENIPGTSPSDKEGTTQPPSYVPEGSSPSEGLPESTEKEAEGLPESTEKEAEGLPESTEKEAEAFTTESAKKEPHVTKRPFIYIPPIYEHKPEYDMGHTGFTEDESELSEPTTASYVPESSLPDGTVQPERKFTTPTPVVTEGQTPEDIAATTEPGKLPESEVLTNVTEGQEEVTEPVVTVTPVPAQPSEPESPYHTSEKPTGETEKVPTVGPVEEGTESPVQKSTETSKQEGTESTVQEGTESPAQEGTESPVQKSTESSIQKGTESPAQEGTESPVQEGTESPIPKSTESTSQEGTESPAQEGTESPAQQVTESPVQKGTESPAQEGTLPPKEPITEKEQVTEPVAIVTAQSISTEQAPVATTEEEGDRTELPTKKPVEVSTEYLSSSSTEKSIESEPATEYVSPVSTERSSEVLTTLQPSGGIESVTEERPSIPGEGQESPSGEIPESGIQEKPEEAFTSPTLTSTPTVNASSSELFTSGPKEDEATTKKSVTGELSTSAPPAITSSTTPPPQHTLPAESYDQTQVEEEDYAEEDQSAFGPGTCRYGGKVYVSAQQIPRDDPCDFCFCFRSDIICLQQSCPPPIPRCHEEPIRGFCCPRYECPVGMATSVNITTTTTTTTTTLPPHFLSHAYKGRAHRSGCQIQNKAYNVGEEIKSASGPCLHCICGSNGQMKCDPKACSPEPMLRQMIAIAESRRRR